MWTTYTCSHGNEIQKTHNGLFASLSQRVQKRLHRSFGSLNLLSARRDDPVCTRSRKRRPKCSRLHVPQRACITPPGGATVAAHASTFTSVNAGPSCLSLTLCIVHLHAPLLFTTDECPLIRVFLSLMSHYVSVNW